MATLREWLENEGVDWESLVLVAHTTREQISPHYTGLFGGVPQKVISDIPGWGVGKPEDAHMFDFRNPNQPSAEVNSLLDFEFDDGDYGGGPHAPMFIAKDKNKTYFPFQYDGSCRLASILNDIDAYMDVSNGTPYPGD